jgi:hypothetical protein
MGRERMMRINYKGCRMVRVGGGEGWKLRWVNMIRKKGYNYRMEGSGRRKRDV